MSLPSFLHWIPQGGWVMGPLLLSGAFLLGLFIEKGWFFIRASRIRRELFSRLGFSLGRHRRAVVRLSFRDLETLWKALPLKWKAQAGQHPFLSFLELTLEYPDISPEELQFRLHNQREAWVPRLEDKLAWADTLITAAPLLGLLGTVLGLLSSFRTLSVQGISQLGGLTGGIAEALIATATGLSVALVGLLGHNHFRHQAQEWEHALEQWSAFLIETRLSSPSMETEPYVETALPLES